MNLGVVAAAVALAIGAVLAVSAREGRVAVLGLTVSLVAAPLVAEPLPAVSALAIRVTGAILAAYLVLAALRGGPSVTLGTRLGWPVQTLLAIAAAVVGFGVADGAGAGPGAEQDPAAPTSLMAVSIGLAAGGVAVALSIEPIVAARDGLRLGIGLLLALTGLGVARSALLEAPGGLEHIVMAAAVVGVAAATAVVCIGAAAIGGDLSLEGLTSSLRARRPNVREDDARDRLEADEP